MVNYPESFPLEETKDVINAVRSGTVKENLPSFAHDLWVVQGFAQKSLIGDSGPDFSLTSQAAPADFDAVEELDKLVKQVESDTPAAQLSVPWQLILSWALKQLLDLLNDQMG